MEEKGISPVLLSETERKIVETNAFVQANAPATITQHSRSLGHDVDERRFS